MPAYIDQSVEDFQKVVNIGNLPIDVTTKQVNDLFGRFGVIVNVYFRRRTSKDSNVLLPNPNAFLTFQKQESIDKIMAERPHIMNDIELSVNRCLPITRRYPYERYTVTNKMLVRVPKENHEEILPNDQMIIDYLKPAGGQIIRFERWEEKTVFVEFDDYDPVDVCCLSRPHSIANQIIEVEKCSDEEQARLRAQFRQKNRSAFRKLSPATITVDSDNQSGSTISPTLPISHDEEAAQLQLAYRDIIHRLEDKHEQLVASLKSELEQIMKERIRLQRLTLDYQQEQNRLTEENRRWKKLYSESLIEKPRVQDEGESLLLSATEKSNEQSMENSQQQSK